MPRCDPAPRSTAGYSLPAFPLFPIGRFVPIDDLTESLRIERASELLSPTGNSRFSPVSVSYVTEALRVIAKTSGDKIIFKGGASLAKGWNLIQRFSEDIDIFGCSFALQSHRLGEQNEGLRILDELGVVSKQTFVRWIVRTILRALT
jgi:hypothetical protein